MEMESGTRSRTSGTHSRTNDWEDSSKCEALGDHCYERRKCYGGCGGVLLLVLIIVISMSWDTLRPTEYGLLKNTITGAVNLKRVYANGRYFVGPSQKFITFPAHYVTLAYGGRRSDQQRDIAARTGAEVGGDSDSGGQPLELSVSFQYQLQREYVPNVYQTYGTGWDTSFLRFAQQAITNVAQLYTPRSFWTQRRTIEGAMREAVNATLWAQGWAMVPELQLRAVGFQNSYEQTITNIQLQEQLKVTKSYQLEVTRVQKAVDLLQSETDAAIALINAEAAREKAVIEGEARAAALQREQSTKAEMYKRMREHLGWSGPDFLAYVKMKALNGQPSQKNVIVGVNALADSVP